MNFNLIKSIKENFNKKERMINMNTLSNGNFSWGDPIEKKNGFILLDEGFYNFTVLTLEQAYFPGSSKMKPCHVAKLKLLIENQYGEVVIKYNLYLNKRCEKTIDDFFSSIGLSSEGSYVPPWNELKGRKGTCYLEQVKLDFKTINIIKKFVRKNQTFKGDINYEK